MSARRAALCKHVKLLDSLLDAIVRLDGDALVMHVGEKPYVVTTSEATNEFRGPLAWGQVELSTRLLTTDAVDGMLGQIVPLAHRSALDEDGATEYLANCDQHPAERFTIVAARGGDDIWIEMRRHSRLAARVTAAPAAGQHGAGPSQPSAAVSESAVSAAASSCPDMSAVAAAVLDAEPQALASSEEEAVEPD